MAQRRIEVIITGDERGFTNALNKSSKQSKAFAAEVTGLKTHLSGLATGLLASGGVVFGFQKLLSAGENLEKSTNQLNTQLKVTGVTAGQAAPYIAQLQSRMEKFGFTNIETNQGLTYLTRATGNAKSALGLMGDAANLARGRHIALSQAALVLGKVWDGNTTALRRLGIILPKHATTMEALAAIHKRFAGQAAAGTTTMDKFRASVTDLEGKLGKALLPTITRLIAPLQAWLSNTKNQQLIQDTFKKILVLVGKAIDGIGKAIQAMWPAFKQLATVAANMAQKVWPYFKQGAEDVATVLRTKVGKAIAVVAAALTALSLLNPWVAIAAGAVVAIGVIHKHWDGIVHFFSGLWTAIKAIFKDAWDYIQLEGLKAYKNIIEPFSHLPGSLGGWARKAKDNVNAEMATLKADMANNGITVANAWAKTFVPTITAAAAQAAANVNGAMMRASTGGAGNTSGADTTSKGGPGVGGNKGVTLTAIKASQQAGANTLGFHLPGEAQPYDCSAFVQAVYRANGITIGRDTYSQVKQGHHVNRSDLAPGDLIFMNFPGERSPGHVGIYVGNGMMVHDRGAHGGVQYTGVPWGNVVDTRTYTRKGAKNETSVPNSPAALPPASSPTPTSSSSSKSRKPKIPVIDSGLNLFSESIKQAYGIAKGTAGLQDDVNIITKMIDVLNEKLKKAHGKLKTSIINERTALLNELRKDSIALAKAVADKGKAAGDKAIAGFLGIASTVGGSFGIAGQFQELKMLNDQFATLQAQLAKTKNAFDRAKIKQEMKDVKDAANQLRTSLHETLLTNQLQAGIDRALTKFDQDTNAHIKSMQKNLSSTLAALDKQLEAGLAAIDQRRAALTPTEALIQQLQGQHDAVQAAKELMDAQQNLADAQAGGDPKAIADAQASLQEILYNQQIAGLQKQADAERAARDKQASEESKALQDRIDALKQNAQDQEAIQEDIYNNRRALEREDQQLYLENEAAIALASGLSDKAQADSWDRLLNRMAKDWNEYRRWYKANTLGDSVGGPNDNPSFGGDNSDISDPVRNLSGTGGLFTKAMAKGGVIRATPGGRLVRVAEGGFDEAIIPLAGPNAPVMGANININIGTVIGTGLNEAAKELADPIRREILRTQRRNGTSAWS